MNSFNYELKALRSKLSRLLDVFESFSSYSVPIEDWYASSLSVLEFLSI